MPGQGPDLTPQGQVQYSAPANVAAGASFLRFTALGVDVSSMREGRRELGGG